MTQNIYFDNSATTPLCEEAISAMKKVMDGNFGNPSSLHSVGLAAEKTVNSARECILASLGAKGDGKQIIFCGSGSEANNLAIVGGYFAKRRRAGTRVIITAGEHSSTEASASFLESLGADVVRLSTKNGEIDEDEFASALTPNTAIVALMLVNNETGARYPVEKLFQMAKSVCPDALCHCDAVQGYLKVKFTVKSLCADTITVSSHKIHGPKGVAALYVSSESLKKHALSPVIHGGQQENGLRAGTENVIGIAGFGAAAKAGFESFSADIVAISEVRKRIMYRISEDDALSELTVNEPLSHAPHILSLTLPSIKSETMLHFLSGRGIYVSSGSACSSHSKATSRALSAFGISDLSADCTIRISLSHFNTAEEADVFCSALAEGVSTLIRIKS